MHEFKDLFSSNLSWTKILYCTSEYSVGFNFTLVLISSAENPTANRRTLTLNINIHQYQVHSPNKECFCRKIIPETKLKRSCSFSRLRFVFWLFLVRSSRCSDRNLVLEIFPLFLPIHMLSVEIASQGGWVVTEAEGWHHSFIKSSNISFLLFHLPSWIPKWMLP